MIQSSGFLPDGRERLQKGIEQHLLAELAKIEASKLSNAEKEAARKQAKILAAQLQKQMDNPLNHF